MRFDPAGEYIRKWVPELRDVPAPALHKVPEQGRSLAPGYPPPMVDHAEARERCLEMFALRPGNIPSAPSEQLARKATQSAV